MKSLVFVIYLYVYLERITNSENFHFTQDFFSPDCTDFRVEMSLTIQIKRKKIILKANFPPEYILPDIYVLYFQNRSFVPFEF